MNTDNTERPVGDESAGKKKTPSVFMGILFSLGAALSASVLPELGIVAMVLLSACIIFITSAGFSPYVIAVSVFGLGVAYGRDGLSMLGIAGAIWLASLAAGYVIRRGGTFHRSLMTFLLAGGAAAAVGGVLFFRVYGITVADVAESVKSYVHDFIAAALESATDTLSLENAALLKEQYEAIAADAVMYIPAVIGMSVAAVGAVGLRLAGFLHTLTGCGTYPLVRRIAAADRVFAVIWLAALLLGATDSGIVGACASNIMLILMVPAAAAGVSSYRFLTARHRLMGKRGVPFSLIMLVFSFVFLSPVVGIMILALTGCFSAFGRMRFPGRDR